MATGIIGGGAALATNLIPGISKLNKNVIQPMISAYDSTYKDITAIYKNMWSSSMVHPNLESTQTGVLDFGPEMAKLKMTFSPKDMSRDATILAAKDAIQSGLSSFNSSASISQALWQTSYLNAANSIISSVNSITSSNAQYQQNINNKSQARTAINGNTTDYTLAVDNTLEYQVWQPEGYICANIAKIFYLCGYSHPVQEKPNIESRAWFNYIQCNPVYDDDNISNINPLWIADYNSKMSAGVTVFHHVTNAEAAGVEWDFAQSHEN